MAIGFDVNLQQFKQSLASSEDDAALCHDVLFSTNVWILHDRGFMSPENTYDEIKGYFADRLGVTTGNVAIIGSAV